MATLRWLFICFCWFSSINSEILEENASNTSESYSSEINAVLNYLNSSPFKVYNYKKATLLNAQIKADIIELILDINVDCINKYPDVPCGEKIVTCNAFVTKNTPQEESKVLTDVNCKPKPEIIIEEQVYDSSPDSTEVYYNQPKPIALSNEAVSSEVGKHFIAVRKDSVPYLGCPFDLNPNAEGVDELIDTALQHIETERPKKQALVKVLKLQQQVVNGVKYILTAEFASTICDKTATTNSCPRDNDVETTICEITYLHKPWISKAKHVIKNNCTVSQEFVRAGEQKSDLSNEIDVSGKHKKVSDNPNFDNMAETGAIDEMTPSRLADLEAQIVVETETELASTIETRPQVEAKIEVSEEPVMTTEDDLLRLKRDASSEESKSASEDSASNSKEDSSEEKRRPKRAIRQLEKISPDEKNLVKNLADFAANALDSIDDDNNKRIILQILGAKKMVGDDGVYYHIIMRMGVSRCLEDGPVNPYENCKDKLFENYTKICKVQVFVNDDFGSKKVVKSQCQNIKRDKNDNNRTNYSRFRRDVLVGGPNRIDKNSEKIRQYLNEGIKGFNANSKENNKFKPVEVISATRQVVAGTLHKITTKISESDCSQNDAKDLDDCNILQGASPKICEIKVWDKPWENFRQFTIKCEGDDRKIKFQTTPKRSKRQIPGGETQVDKESETVKKYVREGLLNLNTRLTTSNKVKPVEVVSATSQVVSGSLHRIKVKISESDCSRNDQKDFEQCNILEGASPKLCEIEVWDKPWEKFRRYTIKCEGEIKEHQFDLTTKRKKRDLAPGGESPVAKDNEFVVKYLEAALNQLDSESSHENKFKVHEVISATSQTVSGHIYRIKAKVVLSDCKKSVTTERGQCGTLKDAQPKTCKFEVFEQVWVPNSRTIKTKCDQDRTKRQSIPGGTVEVDKTSDKVKEYVRDSVIHLNTQLSSSNKVKPVEVLSANSQVVSGVVYRIKVKISESDCAKNDEKHFEECNIREGATPKICEVRVWDKPWQNFRQFNITCEGEEREFSFEQKTKNKRQVGSNTLDLDDPKYQRSLFHDFIQKFNKDYTKKEYKYRFHVFVENLFRIRLLNTYEQGTATYGVTRFADLTHDEFSESLGLRKNLKNENELPVPEAKIPNIELPVEFDWRKKGAVTEVKNQGECGSCWAFSVTGNVEGQYFIQHGKLVELSEQELVDCDKSDNGCEGGDMNSAYRAIEKLGGLEAEKDYPYEGEDETCHFNRSLARVQVTGAVNISHNETDMAKWLVANGPISIAINANAMQFYLGGVSHPFKFLCSPNNLDHGVLVVGYGVHYYPLFKKRLPYWIVKNSWGASWGEQGYYRVYRGDGTCGLNQEPTSAIVA